MTEKTSPTRQAIVDALMWGPNKAIEFEALPDEYQEPPTHYASRGAERVWPSRAFYEGLGITSPSVLDRYGQAQAALYSGANAALLGLPHAALKRLAPETAQRIDEVRNEHPAANYGAEVAGFVLSPMSRAYRAAGDAVAARGFGTGAQAAADAVGAAAINAAPGLIAGEGIEPKNAAFAAGAAGLRLAAPVLPPNPVMRAAYGAVGGLGMSTGPLLEQDYDQVRQNMMAGTLLGLAGRPGKMTPSALSANEAGERAAMARLAPVAAAAAVPHASVMVNDRFKSRPSKQAPTASDYRSWIAAQLATMDR